MPDQPELLRPSDDAAAALRSRPRRERRTGGGIPRLPWRRVLNVFAPVEILGADQVEAIHDAGLRILRDVGVEVLGGRAIDLLERAGAPVERAGDAAGRGAAARVRLEPAQVTELVGLAPARFELFARNPQRNLVFGAIKQADYLLADSLMKDKMLPASVAYLSDSGKVADAPERERVRKAFERAAVTTEGELAYAVWPGRAGGVGLGGAYRVNNAVEARAAVGEVYRTLSPRLGQLVMNALMFDADTLARHVKVAKRTTRMGETDVDFIEVTVAWPKGSEAERHMFESLFGKKLTLATAFVGDQALFTVGADYAPRLTAMLSTARGVPAASLGDEPAFAEALQYKQQSRVSLSYLETSRMAHFAAGLVQQQGQLGPDEEQAVARLMTTVGRGAIVSTTNAGGRRYEMTTHVPHSAIAGVASLNGALWRIALSPLVNPPMMPPMPVPPPHVTPAVNRPADGSL